jgi:aspartyl-tRNA(Asn)/glutamyl-tRNA(Gln) amidotransferase subunit A
MAAAALGTDTGGSCRIPAALNGIAGFKLTAAAVPMGGAFPLSTSLDGVGPLAPTARCCAIVHSVLAGKPAVLDAQVLLGSLRLAIQQTVVLDGLDAHVASCFFASVSRFSAAGGRRAGASAEAVRRARRRQFEGWPDRSRSLRRAKREAAPAR